MNIQNLTEFNINALSEKQYKGLSDEEINDYEFYLTPDTSAGEKTPEGGEVFNDYTDNVAVELAHAEGECTSATGYASHAEGMGTVTEGEAAHAEGNGTVASGDYSHAGGSGSLASHYAQFVHGEHVKLSSQTNDGAAAFGRYNDENSSALFAIGNGSAEPYYEEISYGSDGITYANNQVYYNGQLVYYYDEQGDEYHVADEQTHDEGYYEFDGYKLFIRHEETRKNAFEIFEDGHAEIQSVGTTPNANTVVNKNYVDNLIKSYLVINDGTNGDPDPNAYPEGALWIKPLV